MQAKTKRWVRRVLVGALAAVLLGAGVSVYLLRRPPAVWSEAQQILAQTTPEERAEQAEQVVQRLNAMVQSDGSTPGTLTPLDESGTPAEQGIALKPSDKAVDQTHDLKLSNEELVAVVSDLFSQWTAQRGYEVPGSVTEPVVLADDGRLAIAFEIVTPSWQQVFSGYVDLTFKPDGMAIGKVEELTAGSLPVSVTAVGEMLEKRLPESEAHLASQIGEWVAQLEGFEFRPVLEMEHRRRARVVSMKIGNDAVTLAMRVQDHETYKRHNALLKSGAVAVTDKLKGIAPTHEAIADVPTITE